MAPVSCPLSPNAINGRISHRKFRAGHQFTERRRRTIIFTAHEHNLRASCTRISFAFRFWVGHGKSGHAGRGSGARSNHTAYRSLPCGSRILEYRLSRPLRIGTFHRIRSSPLEFDVTEEMNRKVNRTLPSPPLNRASRESREKLDDTRSLQ